MQVFLAHESLKYGAHLPRFSVPHINTMEMDLIRETIFHYIPYSNIFEQLKMFTLLYEVI